MPSETDAYENLPARMRSAVDALGAGATPAGACEAAGVSPATLRRWRSREEFKAALREVGRAQSAEAMSQLLGIQSAAVVALARALESGSPATKVRAARAVLELAMKFADDEIEQRLSDLERRAESWPIVTPVWSA